MNVFYDLPTDLVLNVMDMMQPADLVRLDSATVCNNYRHVLHEAFKIQHLPLFNADVPAALPQLIWFCKRKVKIDKLEMDLPVLSLLIRTEQISLYAFQDSLLNLRDFTNEVFTENFGFWLLQQELFTCKQLKLCLNDFNADTIDAFRLHPIRAKTLNISFDTIDEYLAFFNRQDLTSYLESVTGNFFHVAQQPASLLTFEATWRFTNLRVINWSMLDPCALLPQLVHLTPNLQEYHSFGAENAAAILQSPSTMLKRLELMRLDAGVAVPNLIDQLSRCPFANSLTELLLQNTDQRYPSHHIHRITQFPQLHSLSLSSVNCKDEDLLFVMENTTLKTLNLVCLRSISHHFYQQFFRTCARVENLEFIPCRGSLLNGSRCIAFPSEGSTVASLKSMTFDSSLLANSAYSKRLIRFEPQFFDMLGSGRFCHLTQLFVDLRAFYSSYILLLNHGCPLLEVLKIQDCQGSTLNIKEPFVLQYFPQGWKGLKVFYLNGNVDVTFEALMSITKSSKRLREVIVKTAQVEDEEQRWAREVNKLYPAVQITFIEDEVEEEEAEVEQEQDVQQQEGGEAEAVV